MHSSKRCFGARQWMGLTTQCFCRMGLRGFPMPTGKHEVPWFPAYSWGPLPPLPIWVIQIVNYRTTTQITAGCCLERLAMVQAAKTVGSNVTPSVLPRFVLRRSSLYCFVLCALWLGCSSLYFSPLPFYSDAFHRSCVNSIFLWIWGGLGITGK